MEKAYKMKIAGLERALPLCRVTDELYIGAFVIFGDPELTTACAKALLERAPEYDYLITAEAKGIPLVHEMARLQNNQKYMLAIVDDVISTGESLRAIEELVKTAGGQIVGKMCILAEGEATEREDITYLEELPLFNADGSIK